MYKRTTVSKLLRQPVFCSLYFEKQESHQHSVCVCVNVLQCGRILSLNLNGDTHGGAAAGALGSE